jgi:hypothetical protein
VASPSNDLSVTFSPSLCAFHVFRGDVQWQRSQFPARRVVSLCLPLDCMSEQREHKCFSASSRVYGQSHQNGLSIASYASRPASTQEHETQRLRVNPDYDEVSMVMMAACIR